LNDVVTTTVGLIGGLIISALFWLVTTRGIAPKIVFSPKVSKRFTVTGQPVYELRIANRSKLRGIVDLSISCRVLAYGLKMFQYSVGKTRTVLPVPLSVDKVIHLRARDGFRVIRLDLGRLFRTASIHHREVFEMDSYDPHMGDPLEYLLSRGVSTSFNVEILAYDALSGARRYFSSPAYTADDVTHGRFTGMDLIALPDPIRSTTYKRKMASTLTNGDQCIQTFNPTCSRKQLAARAAGLAGSILALVLGYLAGSRAYKIRVVTRVRKNRTK
jgi:hypothetical protein